MNILYICDEYPPGRHGGIGTAVQLLAREMVKQGHNVVVAGFYEWGYKGEDRFTDQGVKVYRFRRKLASGLFSKQNAITTRIAYKLLKNSGILQWDIQISLKRYHAFLEDLVIKHKTDIAEVPDYHDYMRFCNVYTPFPALSVPVIVRLHGSITYFTMEAGKKPAAHIQKMEHDLLQQASGVCSVSRYTADRTAQYLDYSKPIHVIYNGIDTHINTAGVQKIPGSVIFTGSLAEKKGIYQLMKAWNIVAEKIPGCSLDIYGKGPVKKIKKLLSREAAASVQFKGHVSRGELLQALSRANLAVFPSFAETFGLGPVEAMACGTAVIFTTRTSGPEILTNEQEGVLVDPANVDDLAAQICRLLQNPDICNRMAVNGMKTAKEKFDIKTIAEKHFAYYSEVINKTRG